MEWWKGQDFARVPESCEEVPRDVLAVRLFRWRTDQFEKYVALYGAAPAERVSDVPPQAVLQYGQEEDCPKEGAGDVSVIAQQRQAPARQGAEISVATPASASPCRVCWGHWPSR